MNITMRFINKNHNISRNNSRLSSDSGTESSVVDDPARRSCDYEGARFAHTELFRTGPNRCVQCQCFAGQVRCNDQECEPLEAEPHSSIDENRTDVQNQNNNEAESTLSLNAADSIVPAGGPTSVNSDSTVTSVRGPPGYAGVAGSPGVVGQAGVPGNPGIPGAPGAPGAAPDTAYYNRQMADHLASNEKGPTFLPDQYQYLQAQVGPVGARGPVGNPGSVGPQGYQGVRGEPGETGPAGQAGQMGSRGLPGTAGKDGAPGEDGEAGLPGAAGPTGPRGLPGMPGVPGMKGHRLVRM